MTTAGNVNDDWEVAVDTGEFDKQLERQEKDRAATQVNPTFTRASLHGFPVRLHRESSTGFSFISFDICCDS